MGIQDRFSKLELTAPRIVGVPVRTIMAADGAVLAIAETAGDMFLDMGTNIINLRGEEAISETEVSVAYFQQVLPFGYVAGEKLTLRLKCLLYGAGTNNGSTIDASAYKQTGGAVGSDLVATAAFAFPAKSTVYTVDFVITPTGLAPGDVLNFKLTSSVVESAGSALAFICDPPQLIFGEL